MKKATKTQNLFLDIYIIVATMILMFAMFISNYALIDSYTFKPFQQVRGVDEICGVGSDLRNVKISYLKGDDLIVFSDEDKYEILEILSSLSIQPRSITDENVNAEDGLIIIDNLAKRKHVKIGFNELYIYLSGKDYNISNNLYYDKLKDVIERNI